MKNILIKGLFVSASFLFITSSASAMTCTNLTKALSKGSENSEVLKLQQFLFDGGYLTAKPNGYFGVGTVAAVKKFQGANGLTQVGSVGPSTRGKVKGVSCRGSDQANKTKTKDAIIIDSVDKNVVRAGDVITISGSGFFARHRFDHLSIAFYKPNISASSSVVIGDGLYTGGYVAQTEFFPKDITNNSKVSFTLSDQIVKAIKDYPIGGDIFEIEVWDMSPIDEGNLKSNRVAMRLSSFDINKPSLTFKIDHSQVKFGERVGTTWTSSYVKSCHGIGVKTGGDLNGSYPSDPITADTILGNSCIGIDGTTVEATATVKVIN